MNESMNFLNAILSGNEEAMHYAVHLYEQAEKYRWHDLRKNPEDLPNDSITSVIAWDKNLKCCILLSTMEMSGF